MSLGILCIKNNCFCINVEIRKMRKRVSDGVSFTSCGHTADCPFKSIAVWITHPETVNRIRWVACAKIGPHAPGTSWSYAARTSHKPDKVLPVFSPEQGLDRALSPTVVLKRFFGSLPCYLRFRNFPSILEIFMSDLRDWNDLSASFRKRLALSTEKRLLFWTPVCR